MFFTKKPTVITEDPSRSIESASRIITALERENQKLLTAGDHMQNALNQAVPYLTQIHQTGLALACHMHAASWGELKKK